ncbi:MAG: hypothetical protein IJU04_03315, partial [Ruminococcus sp.]|nr:hypothetical protein [Ruminococcus sp.]
MLKQTITKAFSGILSVAIALSCVCVVSESDAKAYDMYDLVSLSLTDGILGDYVNGENLLDGKTPFAYKVNMNAQFSDNEDGIDVKPFDVSALVRQKDNKAAADINMKYDGKNLATYNTIYDHNTKTTYLQIPELSDAYLKATGDESIVLLLLSDILRNPENIDNYYGEYEEEVSSVPDDDEDENEDDEDEYTYPDYDLEALIKMLDGINVDAIYNDVQSYYNTLKPLIKVPETKSEVKSIGGRDFTIDSEMYEVSGQDVQNMINAIADKLKNDNVAKDILSKFGSDEKSYNKRVQEAIDYYNDLRPSELAKKAQIIIFKMGGKIVGAGYIDDVEKIQKRNILIVDNGFVGVETVERNEDDETTTTGGLTIDDNGINGVIDHNYKEDSDGKTYNNERTVFENVTFANGIPVGKIVKRTEDNYDGEDSNSRMELTSSINDGVVTINCVESENDKEISNVTITVEPVEPTDIEIPTENIYSVGDKEQLKAYIESADVDGFFANLKSVLGDELYEKLFGEEDEDEDENDPVVDPDDIDS